MLPGFRFLFAAITLSMSLLVFGLGAASLFRAAHEAFASNSPWHGAPEAAFAQRGEANPPVLAALRVDPPMIDKTPNDAVAAMLPAAVPAEPVPTIAEPAAAPKPADALPAESARTDGVNTPMSAVENPPATDAAPQAAEVAANSDPTKIAAAAAADASPDGNAPAIVHGEPKPDLATGNPPTAPEANSSVTKIATLGGPPVEIVPDTPGNDKAAKPDQAKDDQNAIKKREEARRAAQRRQAARARLVAQQYLLQQQANPFPLFPPPAAAPAARQR